jgi:hypothetical protein
VGIATDADRCSPSFETLLEQGWTYLIAPRRLAEADSAFTKRRAADCCISESRVPSNAIQLSLGIVMRVLYGFLTHSHVRGVSERADLLRHFDQVRERFRPHLPHHLPTIELDRHDAEIKLFGDLLIR